MKNKHRFRTQYSSESTIVKSIHEQLSNGIFALKKSKTKMENTQKKCRSLKYQTHSFCACVLDGKNKKEDSEDND